MKLAKKHIIKGQLTLLSGLHIGDNKESGKIGGVDSPVVRRKDNNQPYVPGSSLKGKIRSLLEVATGENAKGSFKNYVTPEGKIIESLFGSTSETGNPSRIIVRDAYLTKSSEEELKNSQYTDMPYTEIKFENVINRTSGKAEHPRQQERVPAGAKFEIEFVINIIIKEGESADTLSENYLKNLKNGIQLLEKDYLGGSGSRGYGQVKFEIDWNKIETIHIDDLLK